jgi:hypothetical protein
MTKLNGPIRLMSLEEQKHYELHNKGLLLDC